MADTIRQQIVDQVIARMQGITIAGAYETDIGNVVEDFRQNIQGTEREGELPILSVYDTDDVTQNPALEEKRSDKALTIQIRAYVRKETPSRELRKIIGDIQMAIGVDTRWNKLAVGTVPVREGMVIESENFEISAAAVEITIFYAQQTFNPYCQ